MSEMTLREAVEKVRAAGTYVLGEYFRASEKVLRHAEELQSLLADIGPMLYVLADLTRRPSSKRPAMLDDVMRRFRLLEQIPERTLRSHSL